MSDSAPSFFGSLASRIDQLLCGLSGHELVLNAEPGRLSLKCMSCPYETAGWAIKERDGRSRRQSAGVLVEQRAQG